MHGILRQKRGPKMTYFIKYRKLETMEEFLLARVDTIKYMTVFSGTDKELDNTAIYTKQELFENCYKSN